MMQKPDPSGFDWPDETITEFVAAWENGRVGRTLVSENEVVRVWHLTLEPGERIGFHMHVQNYFWTALTAGRSRSHMDDGRIVESDYEPGTTRHFEFAKGEYMIHDLANIGDTRLSFVTVEHKGSANAPLPLT